MKDVRDIKAELMQKVKPIADYIVKTVCDNTASGDWSICANDIYKKFNIHRHEYMFIFKDVINELSGRDEVVYVNVMYGELNMDVRVDTEYCKKFEGRRYKYENGVLKKI